jgi:hypothetical protein
MTRRIPRVPASLFLIPLLLWSLPTCGLGQEEVTPILRGQVRVGDSPLSSGMVVLHQVSAEDRGEIDSVRVAPDGTFQIRLPHLPDHTAVPEVFFASVRYEDLLYFGEAITEAVQLDSLYLIQAYDTVSVPQGGADLPVSTRNLFLETGPDGWTATDVFMVQHDGDRTLYSPDEEVVWKYPLPEGIQDFQVGQGDVAPDAVRFLNGQLEVFSPIPPGERYLMVRYLIPGRDFDLPLPGRTDRLEVLVREPAPAGELPPLQPASPVQMDAGTAFRRYVGDTLSNTEIHAQFAAEPWSLPAEWLGLALLGFLAAAGVMAFRRTGLSPSPASSGGDGVSRDQLLVAVAKLDEEFQALHDPDEERRASYRAERNALLAQIRRLS